MKAPCESQKAASIKSLTEERERERKGQQRSPSPNLECPYRQLIAPPPLFSYALSITPASRLARVTLNNPINNRVKGDKKATLRNSP